ncbi:flavin-containing monooxygenase [Acrocarpospora catenulata]|uniref:flavin-containing monooxygenase n=1 Tax=Acrocarpospora catenulata TaxID=2836182 RepID=UPI001BDA2ADA|nr:NAD(P)/FAD-dependent oxidoreductase [Acrocarpospora catenulata]
MAQSDRWARLVGDANVPALLMIVFQFTGDGRWLAAPYAPTRSPGMEEHDDGGLPPEIQAEIRAEAARCLARMAAGEAPAIPSPGTATVSTMLSVCMGEEVPIEYAAMLLAERDAATVPPGQAPRVTGEHSTVLVIGAGVSGLTLAYELGRAGIDHVLVEKADDVGGCWRDNTYPGCGVDTPSHLYSHSYYRYDWSRYFAKRDEVVAYLQRMTDDLGLRPSVILGREVTSLDWDSGAQVWRITMRDGVGRTTTRTARVVVGATGQLNIPKIPRIPGADTFTGAMFHSARWPGDLDLTGRRVAVVGTGASAMQVVPNIVDTAGSIVVFQRSPQWIAPNPVYFADFTDSKRELLRESPHYRFWYRARLAWIYNDKVHPSLRRDPEWAHQDRSINVVNEGHRRFFERYLRAKLAGRDDLIEKSLPGYPPFGKRMLLDNGWFDAIRRPHVELVADSVASIEPTAVVGAGGARREVDVVVLATGFESLKLLHPVAVRGRDGVELHEVWGEQDAHAYLGMALPGFPNLFLMCGPNTNLGHGGSWIQMAEFQARYITAAVLALGERGATSAECKPGVETAYVTRVDELHEQMIWTHPGMDNWYRNAAGRVVTNSPWRIVDYWGLTRGFDPDDYRWSA